MRLGEEAARRYAAKSGKEKVQRRLGEKYKAMCGSGSVGFVKP